MIARIRALFLAILIAPLSSLGPVSAQQVEARTDPSWAEPPRLVVGIVIDMFRADLLYRYWNNFEADGFKRLVNDGAFLRDAHFDYSPTKTGPGHASIYTGTTPAYHGIVGNDMHLRGTAGGFYCASDETMAGVGCEGAIGQRSPVHLMSTTLADEIERRTAGRSKTIGVALKDRGAIIPIGRTGDAAYWFGGGADGPFVSSSWYFNELPVWVQEFNAQRLAVKYLDRTWDLMLPRERYLEVLPDDNPYEIPLSGAATPTLPQDLSNLARGTTGLIVSTPWGNTLTTDMAIAAIAGESLGADEFTDLLAISYSSTDILGHLMGLRAIEMEDMYVRLDREIARLLRELDNTVGEGKYTLFLTADHGAVDVPAYLKDLRGSAGYMDQVRAKAVLDSILVRRHGKGNWIEAIINEQVFLNDATIKKKKIDRATVQRSVADALLTDPMIAIALTATDLVSNVYSQGMHRSIQRGFMPQRSGDVCFAMYPGILDGWEADAPGKGSSHGTVWNYDTHVPVIYYGHGIKPGEVLRRTSITDIAPTIAMIVGMTMPDASIGNVVTEVIAP